MREDDTRTTVLARKTDDQSDRQSSTASLTLMSSQFDTPRRFIQVRHPQGFASGIKCGKQSFEELACCIGSEQTEAWSGMR